MFFVFSDCQLYQWCVLRLFCTDTVDNAAGVCTPSALSTVCINDHLYLEQQPLGRVGRRQNDSANVSVNLSTAHAHYTLRFVFQEIYNLCSGKGGDTSVLGFVSFNIGPDTIGNR